MREKYPWKSFLNDSIALYKWKYPGRETMEKLFKKKRLKLSASEFNRSVAAEIKPMMFYLFLGFYLFACGGYYAFVKMNIIYGIIMCMLGFLSFLIKKAHAKRCYEFLSSP